jgi:hypothetical protein
VNLQTRFVERREKAQALQMVHVKMREQHIDALQVGAE